METKKKKFDAVEMSRELREKTSALLNAMTSEEQIAFLNAAGDRLRAEMRQQQRQPVSKT